MLYISLIALGTVGMFLLAYRKYLQPSYVLGANEKAGGTFRLGIFTVLGIGLIVKVILSCLYLGFASDMNCFYSWANRAVEVGFKDFYSKDVFTDYPPGYVYILYVVGLFQKLFGAHSYTGLRARVLVKFPAILCDVLAAYLVYKIAKKKFSEKGAITSALIYVFNPCVVLDSSIWGQVDGVYTFLVLLMCYYLTEKKHERAIIAFAVGVLIKPQMLFFTPVLFLACVEVSFFERRNEKLAFRFDAHRFVTLLIYSAASILGMILLCLPFGLQTIINQYIDTVGSYNYASVNAYNFWMLAGKNWASQSDKWFGLAYEVWGYLAIIVTVVAGIFFFFKTKKTEGKIYLTAAFINMFVFMFSVRMHERYMFPALVLLLCAFLSRPLEKLFYCYIGFTVTSFMNVVYVLFYYNPNDYNWRDPIPKVISEGALLVCLYMIYIIYKYYLKATESPEENPLIVEEEVKAREKSKDRTITPSTKMPRLKGKDYAIMGVITVIYAAIALYNLGYRYAPESSWSTDVTGTTIDLDFGSTRKITRISAYLGTYEGRKFDIQYRNTDKDEWVSLVNPKYEPAKDGEEEVKDTVFKLDSVFCWNGFPVNFEGRYLRITSQSDKSVLNELVFIDDKGDHLEPVNASEYSSLFDEQWMYEEKESYRSGTYFDEIYHARSAYEMLHGLYCYEWTHPPLGKILISVGIRIFGMNPFGWRIAGTLFGILMLPLIYVFARRLFKKTWFATMACLLFACDFMHFAQTRIATIDVFVTFFIMLMYYFMYRYISLSFYDTKLSRTFIPLGLCGVTMGLAIASKMTGVYGAAGLAVIFFVNLYKRYAEYRFAKEDPDGETNGISHQYVIDHFVEKTWKTILFCVLMFIIIPAGIYTLSYIPFISTPGMSLIQRMLKNQRDMFLYHSRLNATHPFQSAWYQWPIVRRPIWYYSGSISATAAEGISSFGNPFVWWAGIAAFIYTIYVTYRKKDGLGLFLIIGYLAQYLPWILVPRCTFIYHYFPSVPFVILMIVYCAKYLMKQNKKVKTAVIVYIASCVVLFFMFYPVLSGMTVNKQYVNTFLRWMETWVLLRQ